MQRSIFCGKIEEIYSRMKGRAMVGIIVIKIEAIRIKEKALRLMFSSAKMDLHK